MLIDAEACEQQGEALAAAAVASPVTMIRRPLMKRAKEWAEAAEDLRNWDESHAADGQSVEIVLSGTLEPGCTVVSLGRMGSVIRPIFDRERMAIHVMWDDTGREDYINLWGNRTSPVVVVR